MSAEFYWIAVAVITVTASARLTRLATYDKFPPVVWLRGLYLDLMDRTERRRGWQLLAICGYCFSFWATLFVVAWADLAGVFNGWTQDPSLGASAWWFLMGTLGASYLAAILMKRDGDI